MVTIICVYKSGGVYTSGDVSDLMLGVRLNVTEPYRTVCITDVPDELEGCDVDEVLLMNHNWPKWWGKMELFRPNLVPVGSRMFFVDLDTIIWGNIDELLKYDGQFCMLRDFYKPHEPASGLMAWKAGLLDHLYNIFMPNSEHHMQQHRGFKGGIGDQGFIKHHLQIRTDRWQDLFPGQVVSYKVDCRKTGRVPEGARVVCFHGKPKPKEVQIV